LKAETAAEPLVVWRLLDGKPGHEAQSLGLCRALSSLLPVSQYDFTVSGGLIQRLGLRFPKGAAAPAPALIIGAGHATHSPLLAARRAYGGRTVVLMKPTLPLRWFDLCLVPRHDGVSAANVLQTDGVLNAITAEGEHRQQRQLLLIGGPSRHHGWDDAAMVDQVQAILDSRQCSETVLTTSRRTPGAFLDALAEGSLSGLECVPWQDTGPGWVAGQLAACGRAWVSEDSVSMVYEALTAGVGVGLLQVPRKRAGRVMRGVEHLIESGRVTPFQQWRDGTQLMPPEESFNEAARCARWIVDRWLSAN
jgi:mitochondrial fission protein ELM1